MLESIKFVDDELFILNQLQLPHETSYEVITGVDDAHAAIKSMKIRGAPAIAVLGSLSLAQELKNHSPFTSLSAAVLLIHMRLGFLVTARPTAVNLFEMADRMSKLVTKVAGETGDTEQVIQAVIRFAQEMLENDRQDNLNIGKHGADYILKNCSPEGKISVITICNTGSLATAGYGTALGVIRRLHELQRLEKVYALETRPYNQGSRLTMYELIEDGIPSTLICDSMAAALMSQVSISAVLVGADRVAENGDTANKIGTYQLAIIAQYHKVPFIVCAPETTVDHKTLKGEDIPIEIRSSEEVLQVKGVDEEGKWHKVKVGVGEAWHPAFDVTPASLITAIVTDQGVKEIK